MTLHLTFSSVSAAGLGIRRLAQAQDRSLEGLGRHLLQGTGQNGNNNGNLNNGTGNGNRNGAGNAGSGNGNNNGNANPAGSDNSGNDNGNQSTGNNNGNNNGNGPGFTAPNIVYVGNGNNDGEKVTPTPKHMHATSFHGRHQLF